jgi:hypothetical protein
VGGPACRSIGVLCPVCYARVPAAANRCRCGFDPARPLSPSRAETHRKRGRSIAVRYFLYGTLGLLLPLSAVFFAFALSQRVAPEGAILQIIALTIAVGITIGLPVANTILAWIGAAGADVLGLSLLRPDSPAAFTIAPMGIGAASTLASLFVAWWGVSHRWGMPAIIVAAGLPPLLSGYLLPRPPEPKGRLVDRPAPQCR